MKRNVAIIPARSGSKSIKDKNIKLFLTKPLISYSINLAKSIKEIDRVIVSTDCNNIANISKKYGAEVPFVRPKFLSEDDTPIDDVMKHCCDELNNEGYIPDSIILLFPTNPVRKDKHIKECLRVYYKKKYDCVFTVNESPAHYTPYWTIVKNRDQVTYFDGTDLAKGPNRRQDFSQKCYAKNDIAFVFNPNNLKKTVPSIFGVNNKFLVTKKKYDADINNLEDWDIAEKRFMEIFQS